MLMHKDVEAEALRDYSHPVTKALADIGVSYAVLGAGRGAKALLVKRPMAMAEAA